MTSVIFIVVLIAVSGFIAWAGDVLGRVMGKKRIALFGLRPRRTSILIAVITGMLITGLTILALALTSETVRTVITRMDQIRREFVTLTSERDRLASERDEARAAIDNLTATISQGQAAVDMLTLQLSTSQVELESLHTQVNDLNDEIETLEDDRDKLEAEYRAMVANKEAVVSDLEGQIDSLNTGISDRESRLADLNRQILAANSRIENLNLAILELTGQVASLELGEVKVYEGQQLAVFSVDTIYTIDVIYDDIRTKIEAIPQIFQNPATGEYVLQNNAIETSSDTYIQALQDIRNIPSDTAILIVYAAENVVEDQPVPVRLEITQNRKVYSRNTLIYSNKYGVPSFVTDQPYRAVIAQFFEDARNYLVNERSLIPFTSGEALQLTIDDLLTLSNQLSRAGFPAELRIVALTDIYRTDFLVYGEQFTVTILPASEIDTNSAPE